MFSVLVIRLRSLRLLRVSGIVMRLRMFLLLITFLKARSEERFSRNAETELVCRLLLEKKKNRSEPTIPIALLDAKPFADPAPPMRLCWFTAAYRSFDRRHT